MWRNPLIVLLCSIPCTGQQATTSTLPTGAPQALVHIEREGLEKHAMYLASDELGGRYTGSTGQRQAAQYIADHFEALGLEPRGDRGKGYFQNVPLKATYLDPKRTSFLIGKDVVAHFAVVPAKDTTRVNLSGPFAWCGDGSPDELARGGLKRAIPVVGLGGGPGGPRATMAAMQVLNRARNIAKELASRGARAVVFALPEGAEGIMNHLNYTALLPDKPMLRFGNNQGRTVKPFAIPGLFVGPQVLERLIAHMQVGDDGAQGNKKARGKLKLLIVEAPKFTAPNVCAVLKGSHKRLKNQAVVFSAHMDHLGTRLDGDPFNGADDNASGTSALLEIAEAFAKGPAPKRSIVFLAVCGEEEGLWGSAWYADHSTWPLESIVADINIDMIGRLTDLSAADAISVTPSHSHQKFSTLVQEAADAARTLGIELTSGDKYYARSDHFNFAKKGIPVVFFCDGEHGDYHKVTDHPDKLDYIKMEKITRLAFWTGWRVAQAAERPKDIGAQSDWF